MALKTFIVSREFDYGGVANMYQDEGIEVVKTPQEADFLTFIGGADVSPMLYQEPKHKATISDPARDEKEANIYNIFVNKKPMVGICRGAQFLHVMNGGELWQHIDGHALHATQRHKVYDVSDENEYEVTSTHHQSMDVPTADEFEIILVAQESKERSSYYSTTQRGENFDIEGGWWSDTKCLCFQPHPELTPKGDECRNLFFLLLSQYILNDLEV